MKLSCPFMTQIVVQMFCCKKLINVCHNTEPEQCPWCPRRENPKPLSNEPWIPKHRTLSLPTKALLTAQATKTATP